MLPATTVTITAQPAEEAIHKLVNEQAEAWNRNDAGGWTKDFLDDANFINVRGDLVQGRSAIEKIHEFIFSGPYKESNCVMKIESIRYPATSVAIVDTLTEVRNFKSLPPGLNPTAPGLVRARLKLILVERDQTWKIFAAQNTAIVPQPMPVR